MPLIRVVVAAVAGLLLAPWLRTAVFHLSVPYAQPHRRACPACHTPVLAAGWRAVLTPLPPTGRCPHCTVHIGPAAVLVEAVTATALAALAARVHPAWTLLAWAAFACGGVVLTFVDLAVHRLPTPVLAATAAISLPLLAAQAILARQPEVLVRAALCGLSLGAAYLLLVLGFGHSMGPGDARLAALIGTAVGTISATAVLTATLITFALAGLASGALLATHKVHYGQSIAFGPFIIAGAVTTVLLTG